jgi:hypothetical protein
VSSFLQYLVKTGDLSLEQKEVIQFYLDLELRDILIKSKMISEGRIRYRFDCYTKNIKDALK